MTTTNELLSRADVTIASLDTGGGILEPEQSKQFIDMVMDEPTILKQSRVIRMNKPKVWISRMGFGSRILRAARNSAGQCAMDTSSWRTPSLAMLVILSAKSIDFVR